MYPISYLTLRYKNCSMRVKLFASFFLLIFIPIIVLTVFAAYRSTAIIQEQSMEIARLYLQQDRKRDGSELIQIATVLLLRRADRRGARVLESRTPASASVRNTTT
mgnify:CR=1 FL=1